MTFINETYINPLGWDTPDNQPDESDAEFQRKAQEHYEMCLLISKTFNSAHGKKVLKWLRECTIESGTWLAGIGYDESIAHGFAREGQNAMIRDIEERIKLAKKYKSFSHFYESHVPETTGVK